MNASRESSRSLLTPLAGAALVGMFSLAQGTALAGDVGVGSSSLSPKPPAGDLTCPPPEVTAAALGSGITIPPLGSGGFSAIPGVEAGSFRLAIPCLTFDHAYYPEGASWHASLVITNFGNASFNGSEGGLVILICRYMADGETFSCHPMANMDAPALGAGQSTAIDAGPFGFDLLPDDPLGDYSTGVPGYPMNGTVYLMASMVGGNVLSTAIYPTAPQEVVDAVAGHTDADGDYYTPDLPASAGGDCHDDNPMVHPGALEIPGNGLDDDCVAGDALPGTCDGLAPLYDGSCDVPGAPAAPESADLDQDGYEIGEGDCNDLDATVHPGALELFNSEDENCNGVIDEGYVERDWRITTFKLSRRLTEFSYPSWTTTYLIPAVHYQAEVEYLDLESSPPQVIEGGSDVIVRTGSGTGLSGLVLDTGLSGDIPLDSFPGTMEMLCGSFEMTAAIPGEVSLNDPDLSDNVMLATVPDGGGFDLDLRFAETPYLGYSRTGENQTIARVAEFEAVGDCPAYPSSGGPVTGVLYVEGERRSSGWLGNRNSPEALQDGEHVCFDVSLDSSNLAPEIDELNNDYVAVYEFVDPLIGSEHLELIDAWSDGPGLTYGVDEIILEPEVAGGALTGGPAGGVPGLIGAAGGGLILGSLGTLAGLLLARRFAGLAPGGALIGAGAVAGVVVGGFTGSAVVRGVADLNVPIPPTIEAPPVGELPRAPSCDLYLDPGLAGPEEGSLFLPGDSIVLDVQGAAGGPAPDLDHALISLLAPSGAQTIIEWPVSADGGMPRLDLVEAALSAGGRTLIEEGTFRWSILVGEDEGQTVVCRGSTQHSFSIGKPSAVETPKPSDTPRPGATPPTPTLTRTATRTPVPPTRTPSPTATATPVPDTTGPTITSVSHSESPIYESDPKGCDPRLSIVSAQIADPSSVASAVVIFFHTSIGQVPMTHTSGTTWRAGLGPFPDVGDGTVDYQIRATDGEGNTSDSAFSAIPILACIP